MPFDPTYPAASSPATSAPMRAQLQAIVDLIDTIPQGPQGVPGPPGTSVSGAVVDGVTTVPAGGAATAGASFDGANVRFTFGIPRGDVGETGAPGGPGPQGIQGAVGPPFTSFNVASTMTLDPGQAATASAFFDGASVRFNFGIPRGSDGAQGIAGPTGATGTAFTSFVVDTVNTLPPGSQATVTTVFDGANVRFTFGIPQGPQGSQGLQGDNGFDGSPGSQGPPGPPGEVSASQLASAITGTAQNPTAVTALGLTISDTPTQAELQAVVNKVDELLAALKRP